MLLRMKEMAKEEIRGIGQQLGEAMASLHAITFEQHGDLPVPEPFSPAAHYRPVIWGFAGNLQEAFIQRVGFISRLYSEHGVLSLDDSRKLQKYFHQRAREILIPEQAPSLVQNDLDPKNILISLQGTQWHLAGLVDFDRSLALPPEFDLGVMESRWEERLEYQDFKEGFIEGYQPSARLPAGWEARMELFCALECLEHIRSRGARAYLSRYFGARA
jgi:aminoglycoside phosphotransferase (APT) family kinase protein